MMATTSSTESDVSSTTVQVTSIGGQQIFQSGGQQYLIVNKALQGSGGRIQIVDQQEPNRDTVLDAVRRREILARQPSYCKILNELKEVESSESEDQELTGDGTKQEKEDNNTAHDMVMKGESIEVVDGTPPTQAVLINANGTTYQIVTPVNLVSGNISVANVVSSPATNTVQYSSGSNGGSSSTGSVYLTASATSTPSPQIVSVQSNGSSASTNGTPAEEQARKREIRLMKNREAARECRNKKKEYIKCLENRVAVLENQNKALIEELKSLKELYTGQKN